MSNINISTYQFAAISTAIWGFTSMNPFYLWFSLATFLYLIPFTLVVISTIFLIRYNNLVISKERLVFAISTLFFVLILMLHAGFVKMGVILLKYLPLLLLIFYPNKVLYTTFRYFKIIILFFAFFSILIFITLLLNLNDSIPYIEIEGMSNIHRISGVNLHIHGFIVSIFNTNTSEYLLRACGPLQEPGHFAIVIGIVMFIDRMLANRINFILLICGILTFSPAFVIIFVISEIYHFVMNRKNKQIKTTKRNNKIKIASASIAIVLITSIIVLNHNLREKVWYMLYERNLEKTLSTLFVEKSVEEGLNERINSSGMAYFEQFKTSPKIWFGDENWESGGVVLSDYRGMLARIGIVGLFFSLISSISSLLRASIKQSAFILPIIAIIYLHRAWMFLSPYIVFLFFIAIGACIYKFNKKEENKELLVNENT